MHCAKRMCFTMSTIQLYLAAVKHAYISRGYPNPFLFSNGQEMELFKLTLKGVKKVAKGSSFSRMPVTISVLKDICQTLQGGVFNPYMDLLMYAACIMAFFGFMRCGEFTCNSSPFDPSSHLTLADVRFESTSEAGNLIEMCIIHLKVSKIDQCGVGTDIKLFSNPHCPQLCPVTWMRKFLMARSHLGTDTREPLFMLPNSAPLSRAVFVSNMHQILRQAGYANVEQFTGHSFRSGPATSASAINMPDYMLCLLGRWHSDAYKRYISAPLTSIQHAQLALSGAAI